MKAFFRVLVATFLFFATWLFNISIVRAQSTAFTYQGRLTANGTTANGTYDFAFSLFGTNVDGASIAGPVTNASVTVSNGLFTTTLDFGPGAFNGSDYWLEISARPTGSGVFTTLTPRQLLTPTPYALYAPNAGNAATVTGPIGLSQLPSSVLTNNAANVNLIGTFSGNGAGVTNVPGTLPWQAVAGTNQAASPNQAYLLTNDALSSITLPTNANVGDIVTISGTGSNGWQVLPGPGQKVPGYQLPAGTVWTPQLSNQFWSSVACSSDGKKIYAGSSSDYSQYYYGSVFLSTNTGATWAPTGLTNAAFGLVLACSADGTKVFAATPQNPDFYNGELWTSTDSGTTWTERMADDHEQWGAVASSADGTELLVSTRDTGAGRTYISRDSGTNWIQTMQDVYAGEYPHDDWTALAMSADGSKIVAAYYQGSSVAMTTDSGYSWRDITSRIPTGRMPHAAMSADGTKIYLLYATGLSTSGSLVIASMDAGATWTQLTNAPSANWRTVACSADGSTLIAASIGQLYISSDFGSSWTVSKSGNQYWASVACSADGNTLVAATSQDQQFNAGTVYLSTITPPFTGTPGTSVQFQYVGNGIWQPWQTPAMQITGILSPTNMPSSFTGTFNGNVNATNVNASTVSSGAISSSTVSAGTITANSLTVSGNAALLQIIGPGGPTATSTLDLSTYGGAALPSSRIQAADDANWGSSLDFYTKLSGSSTNPLISRLHISGNGNIGIGTTNPSTLLTVNGALTAQSFIGDGSGLTNLNLANLTNLNASSITSGTLADSQLSTNVALRSGGNVFNGTQSIANGSFGVGTTNPQSPLHVSSSTIPVSLFESFSAAGTWVTLRNSGPGGTSWNLISTGSGNGEGSGKLLFHSGGAVMILSGSGVTVPTTLTAGSFVGNGSGLTNLNANAISGGTLPDSKLSSNVALRSGTNVFNGKQIINTGSLAVGTNNPQAPLHVSSPALPVSLFESFSGSGTWVTLRNSSPGGTGWDLISTGSGNSEGAGKLLFHSGGGDAMILSGSGVTVPTTLTAGSFVGNGNGLTNLNAGKLTGSLPAVDGGALVNLNAGNLSGSLPAINGANLTGLNANSLSSGTVPLSLLPSQVVTNNETGVNLNGSFTGTISGNGSGLTAFPANANFSGVVNAGQVISTGANAEFNFNDRTSTNLFGQWSLFAANGRAELWNSISAQNKLSVDTSGNVRAAGTFTASTSPDLAETIAAADDVEAGDIVCADPQRPESVIRCSRNDRGLMGVISDGSGGFLINANAKSPNAPLTGKPLVLMGRVPVKVSTENGPIHIGDYLTPSSQPGVAMRSTNGGTIVGVALGNFDGGQNGKVLCFVKVGDGAASAQIEDLKHQLDDVRTVLRELKQQLNRSKAAE